MLKELTKDNVIRNKKEAIKSLNKLLEQYINDPSGSHLKKANLISYWIKDYVHMINFEEKFEPTKNIAYKRGNVVKLNFGFNIGNEYGGLHYGIVLDNKNAHNSPVLTIIPLTSSDGKKRIHNNSVFLGNELYRALKSKHDAIKKIIKDERQETLDILDVAAAICELAQGFSEVSKNLGNIENCDKWQIEVNQSVLDLAKRAPLLTAKAQHLQEQYADLEKIGAEIAHMKKGSIALVNQITTVSKMRIFDPRNLKGVLAGISISPENMDRINEKVKDLYVF